MAKIIKEKKEKEATSTQSNITDIATPSKSTTSVTKSVDQLSTPTVSITNAAQSSSASSITISANQSAYMMNLYNTFFNQYMQNYAQQKLPEAAVAEGGEYDSLKHQAAFYAQQQQSIQKQLEICLASATQQYLKDILK